MRRHELPGPHGFDRRIVEYRVTRTAQNLDRADAAVTANFDTQNRPALPAVLPGDGRIMRFRDAQIIRMRAAKAAVTRAAGAHNPIAATVAAARAHAVAKPGTGLRDRTDEKPRIRRGIGRFIGY